MWSHSLLPHYTTKTCGKVQNWSEASSSARDCLIQISWGLLAIANNWPEVVSERWLHWLIMGCPTATTGQWRRHGCSPSKPQPTILSLPPPPWCAAILPPRFVSLFFFCEEEWVGGLEEKERGGEGVATHSRRWGGGGKMMCDDIQRSSKREDGLEINKSQKEENKNKSGI